jgi:hypothetical protein
MKTELRTIQPIIVYHGDDFWLLESRKVLAFFHGDEVANAEEVFEAFCLIPSLLGHEVARFSCGATEWLTALWNQGNWQNDAWYDWNIESPLPGEEPESWECERDVLEWIVKHRWNWFQFQLRYLEDEEGENDA